MMGTTTAFAGRNKLSCDLQHSPYTYQWLYKDKALIRIQLSKHRTIRTSILKTFWLKSSGALHKMHLILLLLPLFTLAMGMPAILGSTRNFGCLTALNKANYMLDYERSTIFEKLKRQAAPTCNGGDSCALVDANTCLDYLNNLGTTACVVGAGQVVKMCEANGCNWFAYNHGDGASSYWWVCYVCSTYCVGLD